jgi:uncharacterized protein (UPF0212 family)
MHALTAAEMLEVWDTAGIWSATRRALALLRAGAPEVPAEQLAALSVGRRDGCLLTLREWFFGSRVVGRAACPGCGEQLECAFEVDDIRVASPDPSPELALDLDGTRLAYRLPDSTDLEAIAAQPDEASALGLLLERCVSGSAELTPAIVDELAAEMGRRDPQARVEINVACPACERRWAAVFDVAAFVWTEIHTWAQRMLREVHALASAYGWAERDILRLSAARRQAYLELLGR